MSLTARLRFAAGLLLAAAVAACGTVRYTHIPVPVFSFHGQLNSVAAASPNDAWAVGSSGTLPESPGTLMLHWDGKTWNRVTSPAVLDGAPGVLMDVTAVSASDAWAVGSTGPVSSADGVAIARRPLLLHWDGTRWNRVTNMPSAAGSLDGITVSGHSGWAVGGTLVAGHYQPLILRWDDAGWHRTPTPAVAGDFALNRVAVTSAGTAWASGVELTRGNVAVGSLLMRWNGSSWQLSSFPIAGPGNTLADMVAGPDGTAWAVGYNLPATSPSTETALAMRWTGATWQAVQGSPDRGSGYFGIAVASDGTVWAVGGGGDVGALAMRWTGSAWVKVPIPTVGSGLFGVAFSSPADGWAVGADVINGTGKHSGYWPLIVHWDGTAWN